MRKLLVLLVLTRLAVMSQAPAPRPLTPGDSSDVQTLSRGVQALRSASQLSGDITAKVDKLLQEANSFASSGRSGEARRKIAEAHTLLTGQPWNAKSEFAWSLSLRPRAIVLEPLRARVAEVTQLYPAGYTARVPVRARLALTTTGERPTRVREFGVVELPVRDLIAEPLPFSFDLNGTPDGSYRLVAEILEGDEVVAALQQPVAVAEGIESRAAEVERRLERVRGFESAKASVRWPFDMARVVNLGIRKLETTDFGLPESGGRVFDFSKELRESAELLKQLEAGKDPLTRAKGDHERHYWFEPAGEIMPYRVYVPSTWDGKKQLPMIFVLHGNTRDHNFYFDRDGGLLSKLAEKHGYLVATTMGYRPSAGYNASAITALQKGSTAATSPGGPGRRETELGEKDAMHALDLVMKEFNPDPARIFVFGHSAGGTGGWYLGSKYAEKFAGLALSAFNTQASVVPFERLSGKPLLVIVGSKDAQRLVDNARAMAKAVSEKGFQTQFLEIPEATHDTIVRLALPTVFRFFSAHGAKAASRQ